MLHPEILVLEDQDGMEDSYVRLDDFEKLREEYAVQIKTAHDVKIKLDTAHDTIAQLHSKIDTLATKLHCERAFLNDLMSRMRTLHELTAIESKPRTWPTKEMTQKLRDAGVIP